jgi:ABC-type transport system involved in cytochrome c biogenesis permease subunit
VVNSPAILWLAAGCHLAAAIAAAGRRRRVTITASAAAIALQLGFIAARAAATGFLPFASRFEAMGLYALAIAAAGLITFIVAPQPSFKATADLLALGFLTGALAGARFHPGGDLNPVLQSPWFAFHILAAFAGYGCFTSGLAWSVAHLFDRRLDLHPRVPAGLARAGLLLLGAGILSGAIWADSAWGRWWGWDPKESWALLTWTVMLAWVHAGPRPGRVRTAAFYAVAFAAMMFTFIGINLLKWGQHRY